jgi:hypothetical protein
MVWIHDPNGLYKCFFLVMRDAQFWGQTGIIEDCLKMYRIGSHAEDSQEDHANEIWQQGGAPLVR